MSNRRVPAATREFVHECRIRDYFMSNLHQFRRNEHLLAKEFAWDYGGVRVDMRTVAQDQVLRDWEFKLVADYSALGQILVYVSQTRKHTKFDREVKGVIAAFNFHPLLRQTIEIMNLGVEMMTIPAWMKKAGKIPTTGMPVPIIPEIPSVG